MPLACVTRRLQPLCWCRRFVPAVCTSLLDSRLIVSRLDALCDNASAIRRSRTAQNSEASLRPAASCTAVRRCSATRSPAALFPSKVAMLTCRCRCLDLPSTCVRRKMCQRFLSSLNRSPTPESHITSSTSKTRHLKPSSSQALEHKYEF